jgi:predicted PurR-regulated permease PerM
LTQIAPRKPHVDVVLYLCLLILRPFFNVIGWSAVLGTVYLLMIGAWQNAIVLAVWGAAVVSSVDNVLRPWLVAGRVGLSGVAMFVAMLGGLQAFGALGIVLGPVAFAAAAALVEVLREAQPPRAPRSDGHREEPVL